MIKLRRLIAVTATPFVVMSAVALATGPDTLANACTPAADAADVDPAAIPHQAIAGFAGEQLVNAAHIMAAAHALGLDARAQTIGVMTAIGESGLRLLDHGDAANHTSRGLFQQIDAGWGSYSDRMDPYISATNFFKALTRVDGWQTLPPTIAAHRTQNNADPWHYEPYWDDAVAIVTALAGTQPAGVATGAGHLTCTGHSPNATTIVNGGWAKPASGPIASPYGMRTHPVTGERKMHDGVDIDAPCDAPIFAAAAGTVVTAGPTSGYGNLITIDHGGGITSRYGHMYDTGVLVTVGQTLSAGHQIGRVGSAGMSTGCHLHFEIRIAENLVDPVPVLHDAGITLQ